MKPDLVKSISLLPRAISKLPRGIHWWVCGVPSLETLTVSSRQWPQ